MKKLMGAVLAVLLLFLMLGSPSIARADDEPAPDPVATETATPDSEPSEEPADEAKDEAKDEAVVEKTTKTKPSPDPDPKSWICHPVNGKGETGNGWNLINPDKASSHINEDAYPDGTYWKHQSNDKARHDIYATPDGDGWACPGDPIKNDEVVTEWHTWEVPGQPKKNPPKVGEDVNWPQTYVGPGKIEPTKCGVWYQQDKYTAKQSVIDALWADDKLEYGEDHAIVKDWKFVYGGDCPPPPPPTVEKCEVITAGPQATDLNHKGWDFSQTRATGHVEFVNGGLRTWTEGATSTDKVAGYIAASFPLRDIGEGFGLDAESNGSGTVPPSLQIVLSTGQILVYEPGYYGVGNVWSNQSVPGLSAGMGYTSFGSINDILAAAPDAQVGYIGFSLGSGVKGDWIIRKITVGCTTYTFDKVTEPEVPEPKVEKTEWVDGEWVCGDTTVVQTRTVTTTPYKVIVVEGAYKVVLDTENATSKEETQVRDLSPEEQQAACPEPKTPEPTYTEWTDGQFVCGDTTVIQTRVKTTYGWIWDADQVKWVEATPVETTETQTRDLTTEEQQSVCDVPETPEPLVEYGEWGGDTPTCEVPEVVWTRTVTTTTYRWEWVGFGEENTNGYTLVTAVSTDTEEDTVFLDERVDCSPEPTPEPSKPVRTPPSLAFTGSDMDGIGLGAVLALVGGALIGLARVRRRH